HQLDQRRSSRQQRSRTPRLVGRAPSHRAATFGVADVESISAAPAECARVTKSEWPDTPCYTPAVIVSSVAARRHRTDTPTNEVSACQDESLPYLCSGS